MVVTKWTVWKSKPVELWWAQDSECTDAMSPTCVCRSFNTWDDAMSYIGGFMRAQESFLHSRP